MEKLTLGKRGHGGVAGGRRGWGRYQGVDLSFIKPLLLSVCHLSHTHARKEMRERKKNVVVKKEKKKKLIKKGGVEVGGWTLDQPSLDKRGRGGGTRS